MKVQSLERAFDILEQLSVEQHGLNLTEIGKRLDLHKSTVYRLLYVLKQRGYIEKDESTNLYRLGMGFIELSSLYLNNIELKTEAEPYLRELVHTLNQTVYLATFLDNEVVYIDKVEGYNSLRKYSIIGQRRPLYCTSLGKAYLTSFSENEIKQLYQDKPFTKYTASTLTTLKELLKEVELTRQRGWAFDNAEFEAGINCIGVPIYDYRNTIIAALSLVYQVSGKKIDVEEYARHVKDTGLKISRRLGFQQKKVG